jgi:hypothetical protein
MSKVPSEPRSIVMKSSTTAFTLLRSASLGKLNERRLEKSGRQNSRRSLLWSGKTYAARHSAQYHRRASAPAWKSSVAVMGEEPYGPGMAELWTTSSRGGS